MVGCLTANGELTDYRIQKDTPTMSLPRLDLEMRQKAFDSLEDDFLGFTGLIAHAEGGPSPI